MLHSAPFFIQTKRALASATFFSFFTGYSVCVSASFFECVAARGGYCVVPPVIAIAILVALGYRRAGEPSIVAVGLTQV
jgi:hypothetical protein